MATPTAGKAIKEESKNFLRDVGLDNNMLRPPMSAHKKTPDDANSKTETLILLCESE
jgi:hypothetical protein